MRFSARKDDHDEVRAREVATHVCTSLSCPFSFLDGR